MSIPTIWVICFALIFLVSWINWLLNGANIRDLVMQGIALRVKDRLTFWMWNNNRIHAVIVVAIEATIFTAIAAFFII